VRRRPKVMAIWMGTALSLIALLALSSACRSGPEAKERLVLAIQPTLATSEVRPSLWSGFWRRDWGT